jgi:hypothetical protein
VTVKAAPTAELLTIKAAVSTAEALHVIAAAPIAEPVTI